VRLRLLVSVLVTVVMVGLAPSPSGAKSDAERERERVQAEQRENAANVDALTAEKAEVEDALAALNQQVATEQAALDTAEAEVAEAEADEARAQEGIEEAEAHLAELQERLRAQMVEMYVDPDQDGVTSVLDAASATDMITRRAILRARTADDEDLADQVRRAQADLEAQRTAAVEAGERAEARRQEVAVRLGTLETAQAQQQDFAAQVQQRIDGELARALELRQRDQQLAAEIIREQVALQARLALAAQQEEQRQAAAQAAQQQQQQAAYDEGGQESAPIVPPGGGGVTSEGTGSGGIRVCNASGIRVNCQIASQVSAMITAAANAGVSLSGGGYRDPSAQISLRRQHCGSSYYAIYQMPSSQCRPPTARPGQSNHEVGLAIDFNNCSSRGSACFRWLAGNASRFGFYNLPSEPWHWSVDGS